MLEVRPSLDEHELRAVLVAFDRSERVFSAHQSAWRDAGVVEATEAWPGEEPYALSPRSTRGATRA